MGSMQRICISKDAFDMVHFKIRVYHNRTKPYLLDNSVSTTRFLSLDGRRDGNQANYAKTISPSANMVVQHPWIIVGKCMSKKCYVHTGKQHVMEAVQYLRSAKP